MCGSHPPSAPFWESPSLVGVEPEDSNESRHPKSMSPGPTPEEQCAHSLESALSSLLSIPFPTPAS